MSEPVFSAIEPAQRRRNYDAVYEQVRRALLDGTIEPGTRLVELDLAEQLQVSRTPVREALLRLEGDGFAQRTRNGGLVVTAVGPDDIGDIGLLRVEVDGLAARLAAARGSASDWELLATQIDAFRAAPGEQSLSRAHMDVHRTIYGIGFSPRMMSFFENQLLPYIEVSVSVGPGFDAHADDAHRQHMTLLATLSSGDVDRAGLAAREHAMGGVKFARRR